MPTLLKSRDRFSVKGLGECRLLQVLPTMGTAFDSAGYLENTDFKDILETEIIKDENGNITNVLEKSRAIGLDTMLQQTSIDEINLLRQSSGKAYAVQYYGLANPGMFQYFLIPQAILDAGVPLPFKTGKRTLPLKALGVLKETTPETPQYYLAEAKARLYLDKLQLWVNPRDLSVANRGTSRLDDISGFQRHGTLNSDYAVIWTTGTPESQLAFDGVNDAADFGNVLNLDTTSDFLFEGFFKITAANGTNVILYSKKNGFISTAAGYELFRATSNVLAFRLSDGSTAVNVQSTSTFLQNTWAHIAVAASRTGNGQMYINGVADGSPASIAAIGNPTNAMPFRIASTGSAGNFGAMNLGSFRMHNYGASGLPSNIASIIASHYAAEKSYHGL